MANSKNEPAATLKVRFINKHVHRGVEYDAGATADLSRDDAAMLMKDKYVDLAKDSPGTDANGSPVN